MQPFAEASAVCSAPTGPGNLLFWEVMSGGRASSTCAGGLLTFGRIACSLFFISLAAH